MSQSEIALSGCGVDEVPVVTEDRLLERLKLGESDAFDQLYSEYHGLIFNLAYRILSEREEAFDLTQEVYLKIFRHIGEFNGGSSLKTWIYRITVNACLNRRRWWQRRMKTATVPLSEYRAEEARSALFVIRAPQFSPEELAIRSELEGRIQEGLGQLPRAQRIAVVLRDLEGLSYDEIAETLQVSLGTVKSRIARGRETLRNQLSEVL